MIEKRLVAVCDILGFEKLIEKDLRKLIDGELSLFQRLVGFSVNHGAVPELPPKLKEIRDQGRVGFTWFSDTLLIYAKDDEDLSCRNVLETVGWLLFTTMPTRTRLRCGVAYGEFFAEPENQLFVGPAIVEAYNLEQAQQWAGAALTDSAAKRLPEREMTGERFQWWVCKYPAPLKKQKKDVHCSELVVDWTQGIHKSFNLRWSHSHEEPTEAEKCEDESIYQKWINTRIFHEEVCIACNSINKIRDPLKVL
ncbi:MAG: hypothetical protein Q7U10_11350 [Thermodesulfovibrionia bacterium]|nr:hypothetical protein [Thermodesulfovibrionia bacterium]